MPMEDKSIATAANTPTNSAENRRGAIETSITSFMERTLNTGRAGSTVCISLRICDSTSDAGRGVLATTLMELLLRAGFLIVGSNYWGTPSFSKPAFFNIFADPAPVYQIGGKVGISRNPQPLPTGSMPDQ